MLRMVAAFLVIFIYSPRRAVAGDVPQYDGTWNLPRTLPRFYRAEQRLLLDADPPAARAEIKTWVEENGGLNTNHGAFNEELWLIPADQLKNMDAMLSQYGRLKRGRPFYPEDVDDDATAQETAVLSSRMKPTPKVDVKTIAKRRDTLQAESDSRNSPDTPNIDRLVAAYLKSLDTFIEAQERFDKYVTVYIALPEPASDGQSPPTPPREILQRQAPTMPLLNVGYRGTSGSIHYPTPSGRSEEDYLAWCADEPFLEEEYTLLVRVEAADPAKAMARLNDEFERMGIMPAHIGSQMGPYQSISQNGPQTMPVVSYWVPPGNLGDFKTVVESSGSLLNWTRHTPAQFGIFAHSVRHALKWEQALADELESAPDHLSSYPATHSLVVDQIQRLRTFPPIANPEGKMDLVALEVVVPQKASPGMTRSTP
ncbi:MAG: hypothetical protein ACHQ51_11515 [Elusimicrobiota bacterium]